MDMTILDLAVLFILAVFLLVVARPHLKLIRAPGAPAVGGEPGFFSTDSSSHCADGGSDGGSCDGGAGH